MMVDARPFRPQGPGFGEPLEVDFSTPHAGWERAPGVANAPTRLDVTAATAAVPIPIRLSEAEALPAPFSSDARGEEEDWSQGRVDGASSQSEEMLLSADSFPSSFLCGSPGAGAAGRWCRGHVKCRHPRYQWGFIRSDEAFPDVRVQEDLMLSLKPCDPGERVIFRYSTNERGEHRATAAMKLSAMEHVAHMQEAEGTIAEIWQSFGGFPHDLGDQGQGHRFSFLDLGCVAGGFASFLFKEPRCRTGFGISPEFGSFPLNCWLDEERFTAIEAELFIAEPLRDTKVSLCVANLPDLDDIAAASEEPRRSAPGRSRISAACPALGAWALAFRQLHLGLSSLQAGGVMAFGLPAVPSKHLVRDHFEAVSKLLRFLYLVFEEVVLWQQDGAQASERATYAVCQGFRSYIFVDLAYPDGESLLHTSAREVLALTEEGGLGSVALFFALASTSTEPWLSEQVSEIAQGLWLRHLTVEDTWAL